MLATAGAIAALGLAVVARPAVAEVPAIVAAAAPSEAANFELYFPIRNRPDLDALIAAQNDASSPEYHSWLSPQQFARSFGPSPAAISKVAADLAARGLKVTEQQGLMLHVAGTAAAVQAAFGVRLAHARFSDGSAALVADRPLRLPPALAALGLRTPQFSTVTPLHQHSKIVGVVPRKVIGEPDNFVSPTGPYLAADLRQAYDFPSATSLTAKGVTIGILMSGNYNATDLEDYYEDDGLPTSLWPQKITSVPINGGLAFSSTNSGETELDLEQSGAMSLAANIRLYNLSDLGESTIIFGLNHIVGDNLTDVVSMSFGGPEEDFTAANNGGISQQYLLEIEDELFEQGTAQGMTFVASSGDHGAIPLVGSKQKPTLSVEGPASDPYVVGVGGTNLVTASVAGSDTSAYVSENENYDTEKGGEVWASGGGISIFWAKPSYQGLVTTQSTKFRTVPDVAQHMGGCPGDATACHTPHSADYEIIGGETVGVLGTSASAPDIAGLLAQKVALTKGRLGLENTDIYTRAKAQNGGKGTPFHHKGIPGNNGYYSTVVPYDLVIGNGSVDARQLLGTTLPAAGIPGTSTNP
jgi:subtilase family serine protease